MTTLSLITVLPEQHDKGDAQLQAYINTVVAQNQRQQPQMTSRRMQLSATWQVGADGRLSMRWRSSEMIHPSVVSFTNNLCEAA